MKKVDTNPCPKCGEVKPTKDFIRRATLSQTRSWLRNPNARQRLQYVGKVCNDCSKQVKRNSRELTPAEYERRLINEGKHRIVIDELVKARVKHGKTKLRAGALRALKIQRKPLFAPMVVEVQRLRQKVQQRQSYSRAKGDAPNADFDRFVMLCMAYCKFVMNNLRVLRTSARVPPSCWQKLITTKEQAALTTAFETMDFTDRARMQDVWSAFQVPPEPVEPAEPEIEDLPDPEDYKSYADYLTR